MRNRSQVAAVAGLAAVLVAAVAWADPIVVPPLAQGFWQTTREIVALCLEPLIVLVEAAVFFLALKMSVARALGTSLLANVVSFVAGWLVYAAILQTGRPWLLEDGWALAPLVLIEVPLVLAMNLSYPRKGRLVAVATIVNVCTYGAAMAVLALPTKWLAVGVQMLGLWRS